MSEHTISYIKKNHLNLTNEEILELFKDKETNKDIIIRSQMAMVMHLAKQYHFSDFKKNFDELVSDGQMGVLKAFEYFNTELGVDFSAFCWTCIRQELYMYRNANVIIKEPRKEYEGYVMGTTSCRTFSELLTPEDEEFIYQGITQPHSTLQESPTQLELCGELKRIFEKKPRYYEIIIASFGLCGQDKLTYDDMAEMYGITRQRVFQIKSRGLKKLKDNEVFINYLREMM